MKKPAGKYSRVALGGLLTATAVILSLLGNMLSLVDILLYLAVTPIAIASAAGGLLFGIEVAAASFILIGLVNGFIPYGLYFLVAVAPLGVVLGYLFGRKSRPAALVLVSAVFIALGMAATLLFARELTGVSLDQQFADTAKWLRISPEAAKKYFLASLPTFLTVSSLCYALYIWLFNQWLLERLNFLPRSGGHILLRIAELLEYPAWFGWLFLLGTALYPVYLLTRWEPAALAALNLLFIFGFLLYFKGILLWKRLLPRFTAGKAGNLLITFALMTVGFPFALLMGLYFCLQRSGSLSG